MFTQKPGKLYFRFNHAYLLTALLSLKSLPLVSESRASFSNHLVLCQKYHSDILFICSLKVKDYS